MGMKRSNKALQTTAAVLCAGNFKTVAGYTVQLEWSNKQNKRV